MVTMSSSVSELVPASNPHEMEINEESLESACAQRVERIAAQERAIKEKSHRIIEIEKNMLHFYYRHAIYCEGAVPSHRKRPRGLAASGEMHGAIVTDDDKNRVSSGPTPPQGSARISARAIPNAETEPAPTTMIPPYYQTSDVSKLIAEKLTAEAGFRAEYAAEQARVQAMEEEVEREVLHGTLAACRAQLAQEESALKQLEAMLQDKKSTAQQLQQAVHKEEEKQLALRRVKSEWELKKRKLEEQKQKQMDNVEWTREELRQAQRQLQETHQNLHIRELNIEHLKETIAEREARNRRRQRQNKTSAGH